MAKQHWFDWSPSSRHNHKHHHHVLLKLAISFFFAALAFRLFVSDSIIPLPFSSPPLQPSPLAAAASNTASDNNVAEKSCDLFIGDWVADPSGPMYTNRSCLAIEGHQNCMKNGRPDSEYLQWRWKPRDCELPRFDPKRFLHLMRNKYWAFIGDSISRNHVQSLFCILSQVCLPNVFALLHALIIVPALPAMAWTVVHCC